MSDKAKTQLLLKRAATSRPRKRWGPGDQRARWRGVRTQVFPGASAVRAIRGRRSM